jgi:hypothetical protein
MKYEDEHDDYDEYDDDDDGNYNVTTKRMFIAIIPRFFSIGMVASRTDAGSTSLGIAIFMWKVSMTVSLQNYR